jgi:ABC-2 type transport system permease protein
MPPEGSGDGRWDALLESIALYWRLVGATARGQMQYRFSFFTRMLGNVAATLTDLIAIVVLFNRIPSLAGWTLPEVAFLYGLAVTCFGLAEIFAPGFDFFSPMIFRGGFDRLLTRPRGAFFQTLATEIAVRKVTRALQGLIIVYLAQSALPVHWTSAKLLVLALALPSGASIFFSVFVIGAASTFWTIQANEAVNIFTNGGVAMLSYPMDVYHVWLRRFATFVVPLAFVSYYPALFILDRPDPFGLPTWFSLLTPVAALGFAAIAGFAWSVGVRHYTSVGN